MGWLLVVETRSPMLAGESIFISSSPLLILSCTTPEGVEADSALSLTKLTGSYEYLSSGAGGGGEEVDIKIEMQHGNSMKHETVQSCLMSDTRANI